MCTKIAPNLFSLDGAGKVFIIQEEVDGEDETRARDAIACCPVEALGLHKGTDKTGHSPLLRPRLMLDGCYKDKKDYRFFDGGS
jgi:ferredoxin